MGFLLLLVGSMFVLGIVVGLVVQEHNLRHRERALAARRRALADDEQHQPPDPADRVG